MEVAEPPESAAAPRRFARGARPGLRRPAFSFRRFALAILKTVRALLLITAVYGLIALRGPTSPVDFAVAFGLCLAAAVAALGLSRRLAWTVLYLVLFAAFAYVRAAADETGITPRFSYVIAMERALPGPLPNVWVQKRLWSPGVSALDVAMVAVHISYFVVPHALALAIWRWRPALTARYVVAVMLALYGATVFAALVPTAPPWLAAEHGLIPEVAKVNEWVFGKVNVNGYTEDVVRMNEVAAMPSLHFAVTALALAGLWPFGRMARVAGAIYLALMGFALVYLGEHYIVDLIGGAVLAGVAWWGAGAAAAAWERRAVRRAAEHKPELDRGLL
jgi:membrane-associated phospholipid phosphatase